MARRRLEAVTRVPEQKKENSQAERIIALLGGRENIVLVDACMTRLRVTVKDLSKVAELPEWKAEGALGLIKRIRESGCVRTEGRCAEIRYQRYPIRKQGLSHNCFRYVLETIVRQPRGKKRTEHETDHTEYPQPY